MIENEKMKLEDAIKEIEHAKLLNDDFNINAGIIISEKAIDTILQELNNLEEKNKTLTQYIGSQGMINDYMRYKNTKNK